MKRPERVELCEVGPRDGFQFEEVFIPTRTKISIIEKLIASGLPRIQLTSFVHPRLVPQMADAEEIVQTFLGRSGPVLSGLALNAKGVERAAESGLTHVDVSIATNERHGRDNANMTVDEGIEQAERMLEIAAERNLHVQLGFQTVWGYAEPGDTPIETIVSLAERFGDRGLESLSLADSTGLANPDAIRETLSAVRDVTETPLVLHLHDTRGLGIANIIAGVEAGVTRLDTSLGGLGGCPFIPGATGNVATEDVIWALEELGVETGVDAATVAQASREVAQFLGRPLAGRLYALERRS
ncbi:MAG: hydroxymethylglutaryl-CoA lyase [Rhodothermales bacterium]|nr:hydroxymethylglutaryl-CoA lyase [Rhodothermales bacterium]